jgi:hypothetical protein
MNYAQFVKKLQLPDHFSPPSRMTHEGLVATAITRFDLDDDVRGINSSIDLIRKTRGGSWPTGTVTADRQREVEEADRREARGLRGRLYRRRPWCQGKEQRPNRHGEDHNQYASQARDEEEAFVWRWRRR